MKVALRLSLGFELGILVEFLFPRILATHSQNDFGPAVLYSLVDLDGSIDMRIATHIKFQHPLLPRIFDIVGGNF